MSYFAKLQEAAGAGGALIARALHDLSPRKSRTPTAAAVTLAHAEHEHVVAFPDGLTNQAIATCIVVARTLFASQGEFVHLVNGYRGDDEFGGDRVLGDVLVYPSRKSRSPMPVRQTIFVNDLLDNSDAVLHRDRLLFGVILQFSHDLFRGTKLVFHLLALANLAGSLKHKPVPHTHSHFDDKDVIRFVRDGDLAFTRLRHPCRRRRRTSYP